jgi:DNA polymerase-3 subunit epsilon
MDGTSWPRTRRESSWLGGLFGKEAIMTVYCGLDIETTGLDPATDRLTEIGLVFYRDTVRVGEYTQKINPEREVSVKAAQITGYTWASLKDEPVWSEIGKLAHKLLSRADVIVGHNIVGFDMPFMKAEFERIGLTLPDRPLMDTQTGSRWATGDGKVPSLKDVAWSLGFEYDTLRAHSASYDAELALQCYLRGREYGFFQ